MNNNLLFNFIPDRQNNTLTIKREFLAGRQLVWDCHTKSELLDQWFAPATLSTKTKSMDFTEGGHWHYALVEPNGTEYWGYMSYLTIHPIDKYTLLDAFSNENGDINPDLPRAQWLVSFLDKEENTIVETIVTYNSLSDLETVIQMGMEGGMTSTLEKLDQLLITLQQS